jgi:hypothetical protein
MVARNPQMTRTAGPLPGGGPRSARTRGPGPAFGRRRALHALAATLGLAGLPLGRAFGQSGAGAARDNLLLIDWPFGLPPGWTPEGTGSGYSLPATGPGPEPYGRASVLSSLVERHGDALLILSGMQGIVEQDLYLHSHGPATMWTGQSTDGLDPVRPRPMLPSIDQLVAASFGTDTPVASLHAGSLIGVREGSGESIYPAHYHFAGEDSAIDAVDDPGVLFEMISDALRTAPRMGCAWERAYVGLTGADSQNPQNGPALVLAHAETIGLAFQCGVTRVATLQLAHPDCGYTIPYRGATSAFNLAIHGMGDSNDPVTRWVSARYMMDRIADVLDVLRSIGVLERTLVVAASEMGVPEADGNHPILMMGGAGDGGAFRLKQGQHIALPAEYRITKLLVTIAQYFGLDTATVGTFSGSGDYRGPLTELIA